MNDINGIETFVKNFVKSYYTWDNSKEAIEKRTVSINEHLTKELQDLNMDTVRSDIPTSSTVSDVQIWNTAQSGENELADYVQGNVLEPIYGDYLYSELIKPIFTQDGEKVKV